MIAQTVDRKTAYRPLPWQVAPFRDKSAVLLLTGAAGGGKSRVAGEKIHAYMQKYPGSTGLIIRKSREFCNKSIVPYMRHTVIGDTAGVQFRKSDFLFSYDNGSTLFWGGMRDKEQREGIRSIGGEGGLDIAWMEEANAFTLADLEEILARLRGTAADWQQVILSTNPDSPYHWINVELIKKKMAAIYYSRWSENPHNPTSYGEKLNRLSGLNRQRLRDGLWVQAEGVVYDNFEPDIHIMPPFDIPADWRRFRVIDFGYVNPFICQWWALDNDENMYLYRELYMSGRTVRRHAEDIKRLSQREQYLATICDHDAEDRATLKENGIPNEGARKDVISGINAVQERLKVKANGKPGLMIFEGALVEADASLADGERPKPISTEQEFPAYVWMPHVEGRQEKETPRKLDDHGMDATRYAVAYVDGAAGDRLQIVESEHGLY